MPGEFVIQVLFLGETAVSGRRWPEIVVAAIILGFGIGMGLALRRRVHREQAERDALWRSFLESQERERRRIAAELHDSLGQNILIIRNRALLGLEQPADDRAVTEQFNEIVKTSALALEEVRRTVQNLSTHSVMQLGLTQAVDAMLDRVAGSTSVRIERRIEPVDAHFSPESAVLFYRIVQEALNNVLKHAGAAQVRVHVIADIHHLELSVRDDGRGFEPAKPSNQPTVPGLGLVEMERRARLLGGELMVESKAGKGTMLRLTLPLRDGEKL